MRMPFADRAVPTSNPLSGKSYWQRHGQSPEASSDRLDAHRLSPTAETIARKADFAIVGGGLAGLATACHLAESEPAASIVLLEAKFLGFGASGRNAGLLAPLPAPIWLATAGIQPEHAWGLRHLNLRVHKLAEWLEAEAAGCEITTTTLRIAAQGRMTGAGLGRVARILEDAGIAIEARPGPGGHLMVDLPTRAVNPYRTVLALADIARRRGVAIHESTPVRVVEETRDGVRIGLGSGDAIDARVAVICTNAYTSSLALPAKAKAKVVYNFMVATQELGPERLARLPHGNNFVVELNTAYVFYRLHRGRLVYGGIERFALDGDDDFAVPPDVLARMEQLLQRSFPGAGMAPAEAWGGCYHQTASDLPQIERTGTRGSIVLNVGYGGTGVALTMICGRLAAALACGDRFADPDDRRLLDAMRATRLPIVGGLRFVAGVATDLVMRRQPFAVMRGSS